MFCQRQWALIHIEEQWEDNFRTVDGTVMHESAHNSAFFEKRKDLIITRGLEVASAHMGIRGVCDVVEFRKNANGISIFGQSDKYDVIPIEYKRGKPKEDDCDIMQLCAQAMCLEEMMCCEIPEGFLYYGETKRRNRIIFSETIREKTISVIEQMHKLYSERHTPKAKRTKSCNACSLKDICLPILMNNKSASEYIKAFIRDIGE